MATSMQPLLIVVCLIAHLLLGFAIGWLVGRSRPRAEARPSHDASEQLLQEIRSNAETHQSLLQRFQAGLTSAPTEGGELRTQIGEMYRSNLLFEERLQDAYDQVSQLACERGVALGQLLDGLSEHKGSVHEFSALLERGMQEPSGDVLDGLASAVTRLMDNNQQLQQELAETRQQLTELQSELEQSRMEARLDPLTKLANRRGFDERLAGLQSRFKRGQEGYGIVLFDLDRFKKLNDTYGHDVGDAVLAVFGRILFESIRAYDQAARLGGDEFALLLPGTSESEATVVAERCLKRIARSTVRVRDLELEFSASYGVAVAAEKETAEDVIAKADRALYAAKASRAERTRTKTVSVAAPR